MPFWPSDSASVCGASARSLTQLYQPRLLGFTPSRVHFTPETCQAGVRGPGPLPSAPRHAIFHFHFHCLHPTYIFPIQLYTLDFPETRQQQLTTAYSDSPARNTPIQAADPAGAPSLPRPYCPLRARPRAGGWAQMEGARSGCRPRLWGIRSVLVSGWVCSCFRMSAPYDARWGWL